MFIRFFYSHLILILTHFVFFFRRSRSRSRSPHYRYWAVETQTHQTDPSVLCFVTDKHTVLQKRILHGNMKRWTDPLTNLYLNTLFSSSVSAEYNIWLWYLSFTNHTADWFSQAEFALPLSSLLRLDFFCMLPFYSFSAWTVLLNVDSSGECLCQSP